MAYIRLTRVTFTPAIATPVRVTVKYKLCSSSTWLTWSTEAIINNGGTFVNFGDSNAWKPQKIDGLVSGQCYDVLVENVACNISVQGKFTAGTGQITTTTTTTAGPTTTTTTTEAPTTTTTTTIAVPQATIQYEFITMNGATGTMEVYDDENIKGALPTDASGSFMVDEGSVVMGYANVSNENHFSDVRIHNVTDNVQVDYFTQMGSSYAGFIAEANKTYKITARVNTIDFEATTTTTTTLFCPSITSVSGDGYLN
jgi:hypothetical protein